MVPPALDRPPSSEPVAAAFEWIPVSQNHTPWCTVKERYECCIRQGAHGAEEQPCPGLRTNLQYRRNGARNTGSIRFVLLTAWTDRRVDRTVSPSPLYGFVALTVRPWPPTPNVFLVKCIVSPSPRLFTIKKIS